VEEAVVNFVKVLTMQALAWRDRRKPLKSQDSRCANPDWYLSLTEVAG